MVSLHRGNAHSPTSSLSESSFSAVMSLPSSDEPFEAVDGCSSDDEIVWTANEFSPEEDFILVPQSRTAPSGRVIADSGAPAPAPHDFPHVALSQLSLKDPVTPATATVTLPPYLHPRVKKSKPKYLACKGRMSAGGRSDVTSQALASTVPPPRVHRGRRRRGSRDASASYPSPSPSPMRELAEDPSLAFEEDDVEKEEERGFGARPFVEDSDSDAEPVVKGYEDAVCYITSFLSNPSPALSCSSYTRLIFLQSLIIELGLISPASAAEVPSSLKAAKHLIKTRAFVNIGEYLSVREQGPDKLREIMFSSKKELTSDLRRKGTNKANKTWVKRHGLNVLLVSVF